MVHDIEQIRSMRRFIKEQIEKNTLTPYEIFNSWTRENMVYVQDVETVKYYMALIPMIEERERRLSNERDAQTARRRSV